MAFVQPYTNLNPRRPRRQPTSVVRTDQPSKIYAAALREVLAWENSSEEGEADGAPPRDDSISSYVDAWVGAWLRETRADVASSPRGAWREVRVALENAGAHDADRGAFAPLKIFGRLGDPARDDLVALKQDSTKILAVLTKRDGAADAARVGARKLLGPGGVQATCQFQTITGLTPSLRELDALAHVPLLSPRLREALVSKQTRPVTVQTKRTDLGEDAAAAACCARSTLLFQGAAFPPCAHEVQPEPIRSDCACRWWF